VRILLPLVTLLALSACAPAPGEGDAAAPGTSDGSSADGVSRPENDLVVSVDRGDGSAQGTHPDAEAACAHLRALDNPFAPLPADVACTEIYGGPQSAHITGRWDGEAVDLEVTRVDGCRIAQWDSLGVLLAVPVGVQPPG
jgi:hypothetical protein